MLVRLPWIVCVALALVTAAAASEVAGATPTAESILEREVKRAAECEAARAAYAALHVNRTIAPGQQLQTRVYRVRPLDGEPFYELIERDGLAATEADLREEARRRERFRRQVGGGGLAFAISAATLERYSVRLIGREPLDGRSYWKLAFEPGDRPQASPQRIDAILNRSAGVLWIDAEDHGLARVELALAEPLRLWAGLLGSLTRFEGRFEQIRVAKGVWLPSSLRLEIDGWAPFQSLERRVELQWSGYERAR